MIQLVLLPPIFSSPQEANQSSEKAIFEAIYLNSASSFKTPSKRKSSSSVSSSSTYSSTSSSSDQSSDTVKKRKQTHTDDEHSLTSQSIVTQTSVQSRIPSIYESKSSEPEAPPCLFEDEDEEEDGLIWIRNINQDTNSVVSNASNGNESVVSGTSKTTHDKCFLCKQAQSRPKSAYCNACFKSMRIILKSLNVYNSDIAFTKANGCMNLSYFCDGSLEPTHKRNCNKCILDHINSNNITLNAIEVNKTNKILGTFSSYTSSSYTNPLARSLSTLKSAIQVSSNSYTDSFSAVDTYNSFHTVTGINEIKDKFEAILFLSQNNNKLSDKLIDVIQNGDVVSKKMETIIAFAWIFNLRWGYKEDVDNCLSKIRKEQIDLTDTFYFALMLLFKLH